MSSGNGVLNTPFELVTSLGFAGFVLLLLAMPLAFWAVSSNCLLYTSDAADE